MERLTQPGYEYHSCEFMEDGVYIYMNLLREYEDTGLTPQEIAELTKPIKKVKEHFGDAITVGQIVDFLWISISPKETNHE